MSFGPGPIAALALGVGLVLVAIAPLIAPHDAFAANPAQRLRPPEGLAGLDGGYVLGTDQLGRDMLTRILYGGRISLAVGFLAVAISAPLGVTAGLLAGYFGGAWDNVLMRIADVQFSIPFILFAIAIIGAIGANTQNVILVLGFAGWPIYARVTRSKVLVVRTTEYVEAARAMGASPARIILRHILPNTIAPVVVIATFAVAQMITLESTLSFLGLGVQPPTPSWGQMLSDGKGYLNIAWWLSTFPGLTIATLVIAINFVGDWLHDLLDPRFRT